MKILVFEYITGGGLSGTVLPPSLAREGDMMLLALLHDLAELPDTELVVCRDARLPLGQSRPNLRVVSFAEDPITSGRFDALIRDCDAVWPIAPETGGVLETYCACVESAQKRLLTSPSGAVRLCGDKWLTFAALDRRAIPAIPTAPLPDVLPPPNRSWVVKTRDGAGCGDCFIVNGPEHYRTLLAHLPHPECYLLQPLVDGRHASLSCLFKRGRAALLSYNEQRIEMQNGTFELHGCLVNAPCPDWETYRQLSERVAQAFPELWGYAGIDLIETDAGPLIVEINPRLTTSYAGLSKALQTNVAGLVTALAYGDLPASRSGGSPVEITI